MKENNIRAKYASSMLLTIALVSLLLTLSSIIFLFHQNDILAGEEMSIAAALSTLALGMSVIIYVLLFIFSSITFILWFRRAYANLERLGLKKLDYSNGTAAWCWFVPIANWFIPVKMMQEMWGRATGLFQKIGEPPPAAFKKRAVGWWWFWWLIVSIGIRILDKISDSVYGSDVLSYLDVICFLFIVIAALFAVRVVKKYNQAELILFEKQAEIKEKLAEEAAAFRARAAQARSRDPYFQRKERA